MKDYLPLLTAQILREAALAHVARFAATRQGLRQVLQRRVKRWGMRALRSGIEPDEITAQEQSLALEIEKILDAMEELKVIDDESFAQSRTRNLMRTGRSRRAVQAHLLTKGVDSDLAEETVKETLETLTEATGEEAEFVAALILARKRGLGAFQRVDREGKDPHKILAIFARNGFSHEIAKRALAIEKDEAEDIIYRFRSL
ncbi:regulatory protein RecX [Aristophania vespae]|uniref:regulatory protein RecX n=1 Tax=Aristophania vespae TaxID=2697033 RepID=UPI002351B226|nr:RecX family transcriptional regulator [Aristophania vespae]UMM64133.1 Regulatory protein RecX [Aristophania vespae]